MQGNGVQGELSHAGCTEGTLETEPPCQPPLLQLHHHHPSPLLKQRWKSWLRKYALPLGAVLAGVGIAWVFMDHTRQRGQRKKRLPLHPGQGEKGRLGHREQGADEQVRIPLRDVVRFKERQWFIEEVENARQGDANAMLRLAKMHLHGQGCERNLPMAQEWLRKARYMGIFSTIDEIWAGEPEELEDLRAATIARAAKRRAASAATNASTAGTSPGMAAARI